MKHRQAHRDLLREGFVEVRKDPLLVRDFTRFVFTDSAIHPDGTRLYVKMEAAE